jgi:cell wall-associated NlpC family hydrolase
MRDKIVAEARLWLRTPYHHCADVRGAGVDCAMLLVRVYQAVGLTPPGFDPRPYSPQWHLHRGEELYQQWLDVAGAVPVDRPKLGDIGLWKFGRAYSHAAILSASGGLVIHALKDSGCVIESRITEQPLLGRAVRWYTVPSLDAGQGG